MSFMPLTQHVKFVPMNADLSEGTGTETGTAVDTDGFEELTVVVHSGTNQATGTIDIHLEESDVSGSGFADITGAVFTQITTSNDVTVYTGRVHLQGRKRYIRAIVVTATAAGDVSVMAALSSAINLPVSQVNAVVFDLDPA